MTADTPSHSDLRKAAEAATPGPWQNGIDDLEGVVAPYQPGLGNVVCTPPLKRMYSSLESWPANAHFIALANPSAVLSLLDEITALRGALERVDQTLRVPAAEYVPAIRDAWDIIDAAKRG